MLWTCGSGKYEECLWNLKVSAYGFLSEGRTGGLRMSTSTLARPTASAFAWPAGCGGVTWPPAQVHGGFASRDSQLPR